MRRLAKALGVEFTFVDAANKDEMFIQWIGERVMESREERKKVMVSFACERSELRTQGELTLLYNTG